MSICMATISVVPKEDEDFFSMLGYNQKHAGKLFGGLLSTRELPGRDGLYVKLWYFATPVPDSELTILVLVNEEFDISPAHSRLLEHHSEALAQLVTELMGMAVDPEDIIRNVDAGKAARDYIMSNGNYVIHIADVNEEMFCMMVQTVPLNGHPLPDE